MSVTLTRVTKRFAHVPAVDDVSLDVRTGELLAILGPSGCGKSTTLRMIAGLESPDEGRILLGGADVTHVPPHRRDVNTVFQSYALFPHMTVEGNIAYGLKRRGASDIASKAADVLRLVGLDGFGHRKPQRLSGGEQQRVALARALVNHPSMLLLDEPLGALDLALRRQMQTELKRIQSQVGITFVHVTHDQDEALAIADRIVVMRAGRIEQIGTPAEVYERPATGFVATFLGAANMLRARRRDATTVVLDDDTPIAFCAAADEMQIGVRPEKISLVVAGGGAPGNRVEGIVASKTFSGTSWTYVVVTPNGTLTVHTLNNGGFAPEPGVAVTATWDREHTFAIDMKEYDRA